MNHEPMSVHPRLHMGCGEPLRSKLLLDVPRQLHEQRVDRSQSGGSKPKTLRGRTRE